MSVRVKIGEDLVKAIFCSRRTRFSLLAEVENKATLCYLPNPGRLEGLLLPGAELLIRRAEGRRKTSFDVVGVSTKGQIVTIDSRIPNALMWVAFHRPFPSFPVTGASGPKPNAASARLDFLLDPPCLVEVKSCTLVKAHTALFPDAATERGRRHLAELLDAHQEGYRACMIFVVQREDADIFRANDQRDPKFGLALRESCAGGVEALAYTTRYREGAVELVGKIPVAL